MHDFRAKLSDSRIASLVESYLIQARVRRGLSSGPCGEDAQGPISINLDLTLACDFRCAHCIDAELLNGGRHLPLDLLAGTLDVLTARGLRSVILIGGGEPTLHPNFEDIVAAIKERGLECAIVSNGAHNERIARVAERLGPADWVRLSLDAGTDGTFQRLHLPRKPVTLEHICRTAGDLKRLAPRIQLGYSFIVMWHSPAQIVRAAASNVDEMHSAAELAKANGFDYISFKPMLARDSLCAEVVNLGQSDGAIEEIRRSLRAAQASADCSFRVVPSRNLVALLEGHGLERSSLQPRECHMQQFRQVLTPLGLFACPAHRGNAHSRVADSMAYGNPEAGVQTANATQLQILKFDASVECRHIACIYNEVNWWLEELIESGEPIQHLVTPDFFL